MEDNPNITPDKAKEASAQRAALYEWAKAQVTEAELEEARRQTGGRPLAAILADLEKQGCATK